MRPLAAILLIGTACAAPRASAQAPAPAPARQQQAAPKVPVIVMIATGGTIAMKIDPEKNAPVPAISGEDLVATVPELGKIARVEVQNLSNVPSDYMDPERWVGVAKAATEALARREVAGVIISHGTDTLEETAWFLDLTVSSDKPIVLIGAQRNASERDFDGPRNILNAARICVSPEARGKGAMIALNNQINAAREATKAHTSSVETFRSGELGFIGIADHDRVVFYRAPTRRQHVPLAPSKGDKAAALPRVEIVAMYGGADGALLKAALASGVNGIVVQALGWGNVNIPMYEAIQEAVKQGVPVVISTRVPQGRVLPVYGFKGGGKTLQEAGAVFADDLSPQKARILLMLALQTTKDAKALQKMFDR
ncbi:MAG TPA: asparaginase [Myxococcaceae bacterium]|nr:asparaginase [Myxococcaceae bacterium]